MFFIINYEHYSYVQHTAQHTPIILYTTVPVVNNIQRQTVSHIMRNKTTGTYQNNGVRALSQSKAIFRDIT